MEHMGSYNPFIHGITPPGLTNEAPNCDDPIGKSQTGNFNIGDLPIKDGDFPQLC